jgi:hypothetical protein
VDFTIQAMNYFEIYMQLQWYLLLSVKGCDFSFLNAVLVHSTTLFEVCLSVCVHHIRFNGSRKSAGRVLDVWVELRVEMARLFVMTDYRRDMSVWYSSLYKYAVKGKYLK